MLSYILIAVAIVVFLAAWVNFRSNLERRSLEELKSKILEKNTPKEVENPQQEIAKLRTRKNGKFVADNPNTDKNEAFKSGTKPPRMRKKKSDQD